MIFIKHKVIIATIILFALISLSCISAADNNATAEIIAHDTDINAEEIVAQDKDINTEEILTNGENDVISSSNVEILNANDNGTFKDLQIKIDAAGEGDTINLTNDYTYNGTDEEISINKSITINGNGFTINALKNSRIFNIKASSNIFLNNITFVNGKSDLGGAIFFNNDVSGIVINNCKFINNSATKNGGALYVNGTFTNSIINNTEFTNNDAAKNGGAVYIFNSSSESTFENLTFASNNAKGADGGAINFHWALIKTKFNNITFNKNSAKNVGGAINTDQNINED